MSKTTEKKLTSLQIEKIEQAVKSAGGWLPVEGKTTMQRIIKSPITKSPFERGQVVKAWKRNDEDVRLYAFYFKRAATANSASHKPSIAAAAPSVPETVQRAATEAVASEARKVEQATPTAVVMTRSERSFMDTVQAIVEANKRAGAKEVATIVARF